MSKQDLSIQLELQTLKKENVSLQNKLNRKKVTEDELKDKIKSFEESFSSSGSRIENLNLEQIKLSSNIRDEYQFEEIEELAQDILNHGQLQPALISKDNFLLAGYRRYHAIKYLNENKELFPQVLEKIPAFLVVYKLEDNIDDLTEEKVQEIQLSENEQRRSIDNFQLSKLFNKYIEKGFEQKYIVGKFNKSKTFVSAVVNFKNIDSYLVNLIKEFQVYGVSKNKFTSVNSTKVYNSELKYEKEIIGWKPLYEIAKQENITEQKKVFLKLFKNRLSDEEVNSEYFQETFSKKENVKPLVDAFRHIKTFQKSIQNIDLNLIRGKEEHLEKIKNNINQIELLLDLIIKDDQLIS